MAYEEVGGCRTQISGFFHGECPIHETGRQSYAKRLTYYKRGAGDSCALSVCPFVQIEHF